MIGKLSEGKASHVPYRDSKLTRLLQSSLSGHGHVSVRLLSYDISYQGGKTLLFYTFSGRSPVLDVQINFRL